MFNSLRQRLSTFRRRPSPIASLVDFSLWTLRFGLPPWRPKFWIVLGLIVVGILGAIFLPKLSALFMMLTSLFAVGVILVLMLSYFRTFMGVEFATLEQTGDRLAARIAKSNGLVIQGRPSQMNKMDPEGIDALVNESLSQLLESDFMTAIATSHDQLREEVAALQVQLNHGDAPQSDLAQLKAELNLLQKRTERQLRLDSSAIAHLTAQLDEVALRSSTSTKSPATRRASRPKSA